MTSPANSNTLQYITIHYNTIHYNTILYNTLNYAIVSRHQINTCTVLHSSVLYCIKREGWKREMRKFAYKEQTDRQTFQKLKSTLFLYGSSPDTRGSWPILSVVYLNIRGVQYCATVNIPRSENWMLKGSIVWLFLFIFSNRRLKVWINSIT